MQTFKGRERETKLALQNPLTVLYQYDVHIYGGVLKHQRNRE